jgi:hypothetical protein
VAAALSDGEISEEKIMRYTLGGVGGGASQ